MKKYLFLTLIFLLVGCYDYKELNDIAIVKGASIDIENNEYVLNYAIANPHKENDDAELIILKGKGKTISEAVSDMNLTSSKETYIGHLLILIISEDVAKIGLNNVMDYFFRNPISKKTFQIVIAKDTNAEEILKTFSPISNYSIDNISQELTNENSLFLGINTTLLSFIKAVKDPGINPLVSGITIKNDLTKLDKIAIFEDDKFIKWADEITSKGLTILYNQTTSAKISVSCDKKNIVFVLNDIKIKKHFINDKINIKIDANTEIEEMTCNYNLKNEKEINYLEKLLINELKKILNQTIYEIKNSNIDSLGIGFYIYQNNYQKYMEIKNDYLKKIPIEFEIEPNLLINIVSNEGVLSNG